MPQTYKVKLGDTLSRIGQTYGLDYNKLAQYNNISDPNRIYAGQTLNLYDPNQQQAQQQPVAPTVSTSQGLVDKIGQGLKPQTPYDQVNPYNTYAAPQMEVYNQWLNQMAKPEFQKYTMDPFQESYANNAAANGTNMMGNGAGNYQAAVKAVQTPFENQIAQAKQQYEQMIQNNYDQARTQYYNSPLTNFNYQSFQ